MKIKFVQAIKMYFGMTMGMFVYVLQADSVMSHEINK